MIPTTFSDFPRQADLAWEPITWAKVGVWRVRRRSDGQVGWLKRGSSWDRTKNGAIRAELSLMLALGAELPGVASEVLAVSKDAAAVPWFVATHAGLDLEPGSVAPTMLLPAARRVSRVRSMLYDLGSHLRDLQAFGILHRDIKPANICEGDDGHFRLIDWGLATSTGTATRELPGLEPREVQPGHLAGTPMYMSPEQAVCPVVTAASDWYSAAVSAMKILGYDAPHTDRNSISATALMRRRASERPARPAGMSEAMWAAFEGALGLHPGQRLHPAELADRLEEFESQ